MASAPDTTTSTQLNLKPGINEEWKRNIWNQKIVTSVLINQREMVQVANDPN